MDPRCGRRTYSSILIDNSRYGLYRNSSFLRYLFEGSLTQFFPSYHLSDIESRIIAQQTDAKIIACLQLFACGACQALRCLRRHALDRMSVTPPSCSEDASLASRMASSGSSGASNDTKWRTLGSRRRPASFGKNSSRGESILTLFSSRLCSRILV